MKIVYLTTAWRKQDYAKALSEGKKVPNPAGQNFHRRLIEGLVGQEGVSLQVYCLVNPVYGYLSLEPHVLKEGSAFTYLPLKSNKLAKLLQTGSIARQIKKGSEAQAVILYDSLSLASSMVAEKLAKLTSWKRVAICTDNPDNITGSPAYVNAKLLSVTSNADGYFALTKGLAQLFNPSGKPTFFD